jgi:hypothetical protein
MVRLTEHGVVLKIGYLNDLTTQGHLREDFERTFDIVIVGDGSLQPVNYLLSHVFAEELIDVKLDHSHRSMRAIKALFA